MIELKRRTPEERDLYFSLQLAEKITRIGELEAEIERLRGERDEARSACSIATAKCNQHRIRLAKSVELGREAAKHIEHLYRNDPMPADVDALIAKLRKEP